jgi:hypothetical protein
LLAAKRYQQSLRFNGLQANSHHVIALLICLTSTVAF